MVVRLIALSASYPTADQTGTRVFVDTGLLIQAAEAAHAGALAVIRARRTLITPNQLHEFLNVDSTRQREARKGFLRAERIEVFSGPRAGQAAQSPVFQLVFHQVAGQHGRADAALAAFARVTSYQAITMERRLFHFLTLTRPDLQVPIRRIR